MGQTNEGDCKGPSTDGGETKNDRKSAQNRSKNKFFHGNLFFAEFYHIISAKIGYNIFWGTFGRF